LEPAEIRVVDAEGRTVYQWGEKPMPDDAVPLATLNLSEPLQPWQLQHFGPATPLRTGKSTFIFNLLAAGGVLGAGLLSLAIYLWREIGRETREAQQRVSFVNQVSHELKTPLTNIRLYADLLARDLDRIDPDQQDRVHLRLSVINDESSRLGRLINNVLSFARLRRGVTHIHRQIAVVDDVVRQVVDQFKPSLDQLGIEVMLDLNVHDALSIDVDVVEQILGNLISNVEKYAASGKQLSITSRRDGDRTLIEVADRGPGISPSFEKRMFEPFERAAAHIESATGTGIGLAIARELAERHGGELRLLKSNAGARFLLALKTPDDRGEIS
jgi:signal transduction histidine kinase